MIGLKISVFICAIVFSFYLLKDISIPFVGYNAWNFNTYSLIAHNYLRYGYFDTKLAPVISLDEVFPNSPEYYFNHPPLISIFQSVIYFLAGETFATSRIPFVVSALGCLALIYFLGRKILDRRYGVYSVLVFSLLPAMSIFGQMIGQEIVLLFFTLLSTFFIIDYYKYKKKSSLIFSQIFIFFAVLSDWPGIYFSWIAGLLMIRRRFVKEAIITVFVGTFTGLMYLVYVFFIAGGVEIFYFGFLNRSIGSLLSHENWLLLWSATIFSRIFIYYGIIFVIFSIYFVSKKLSRYKNEYVKSTILLFLFFGGFHIFLYPEGSYGHAYWIIYLTPAIVYSVSCILYSLKNSFKLILIIIVSLLNFIIISEWKSREYRGNIFRYELVRNAVLEIGDEKRIILDKNGLLDKDLFNYKYRINAKVKNENDIKTNNKEARYFIRSCWDKCELLQIDKRHQNIRFLGSGVEMIIYDLDSLDLSKNSIKKMDIIIEKNNSTLKKLYNSLLSTIKSPQL